MPSVGRDVFLWKGYYILLHGVNATLCSPKVVVKGLSKGFFFMTGL